MEQPAIQELTDPRVKIIMDTFNLASATIDAADRLAWVTRNDDQKLPEPDMDVWIMYDVPTDAFNVQFWLRGGKEVARQPFLKEVARGPWSRQPFLLAIFTCTCADLPEKSWDQDIGIEGWRLALTTLREWTMKPRKEQIANTNCDGKCDTCLPKKRSGIPPTPETDPIKVFMDELEVIKARLSALETEF
jgi:hypothetical protein